MATTQPLALTDFEPPAGLTLARRPGSGTSPRTGCRCAASHDGTILVATSERADDAALGDALERGARRTGHLRLGQTRGTSRTRAVQLFDEKVADDGRERALPTGTRSSRPASCSRGRRSLGLVILGRDRPWRAGSSGRVADRHRGCSPLVSLVFLAGTAFKFFVALRGAQFDVVERVTDAEVAALTDDELPVYTVLVPVFREANIVAQLVDNLGKIDYPVDKLEVLDPDRGGRHRHPRRHRRRRPAAALPHRHRSPKGAPADQAARLQRRTVLRHRRVPRDLRRRRHPGSRPAQEGARRVPSAAATRPSASRRRSTTSTPTRTCSPACSRSSTRYWFDYMLAGLDARRPADPAGRHLEPLPHRGAHRARRLGPVQRHRGRRPRHPRQRPRLPGRRRQLHDDGGGEHLDPELHPAAQSRWIKGYMQTTLVHARRPAAADPRDRASAVPELRAADRRDARRRSSA